MGLERLQAIIIDSLDYDVGSRILGLTFVFKQADPNSGLSLMKAPPENSYESEPLQTSHLFGESLIIK